MADLHFKPALSEEALHVFFDGGDPRSLMVTKASEYDPACMPKPTGKYWHHKTTIHEARDATVALGLWDWPALLDQVKLQGFLLVKTHRIMSAGKA